MEISKEKLEELLREAEVAHAQHEQKIGEKDTNWPTWYTEYILQKLEEQ